MSGQISFSDSDEKSYIQNEQQRLLKKSNIYKQKEKCNNSCVQHPNKKAKYYVQQDVSKLFCSKCALALALKGLKIEETQENQPEIYRQQRIQGFQEQLSEVIKQCSNRFSQLSYLQMNGQKQLKEQKENCSLFFETIINTSNQLKLTHLSKLETDHIDQLKQVTDRISLIQQIDAQLKQFEIDIANNHENIVKNMEMKPFEDIMCRYEKKVSQIKVQIQEFNQEYLQRSIKFEHNQILAAMNKMCYTLLFKTEYPSDQLPQQLKLEDTPKIINKYKNSPAKMKVFELLEGDDIYQSTCSNPVKDHIQSPAKNTIQILEKQQNQKENTFLNPVSTLQNSRRESYTYTNTPESYQIKGCLDRINPQVTSNERDSLKPIINVGEQNINNQFELNDKYYEKQKITIEGKRQEDLQNQQLTNNINQVYVQRLSKQSDRDSFEDRQLTPKHQKHLTNATPQTFKLLANHVNQKSQYQYPLVNNNVLEQKNQTEISKKNYDSQPQQKPWTPLHQNAQPRINNQLNHKQDNNLNRRANSKQPSIDQIEGKRQFILANMNIQQYTSQPNQDTVCEDTLKERIHKELCSHPPESIYNQVLKQNCQSKQNNSKQPQKENIEQSTTGRMKSVNGYQCAKKQSYQL
ncbi:unnamed protein product (macronuclear) [Paramecium tetraurelia]|uniref:Uncharacterized protein n=1 Tax=Paramecium tetraurelia TaxID=5888 RepID=A0C7U6_PARTE|nr:uncharacterized protein GSPATT00035994001 [Paramecium tetraurelia]CAK66863.1 unnamed protein product [Paramecium tetraurelia]|eukprot:XP_001434260.1 hypothetical protein (macronuclear) [Paramecium tetraurelia strain d4-2]